jgi:hypothetical protein
MDPTIPESVIGYKVVLAGFHLYGLRVNQELRFVATAHLTII